MEQILITNLTLEQLLKKFSEIIESKIAKLTTTTPQVLNPPHYMSRAEVCKLLKISLPTLNDWSKQGWLAPYKLGNRVLYKEQEVKAALETNMFTKHKRGQNKLN